MPRFFISHSSKDNVAGSRVPALACRQRLGAEDVFIDLHGIGAGDRWRDTLRKANSSCEAVILLASPASLDSAECQREINLAEDLGKQIIVALLSDLKPDDPRLARFADRQFVDLSAEPTERMEAFEPDGQRAARRVPRSPLHAIKARLARSRHRAGQLLLDAKVRTPAPIPASPPSARTTRASFLAARRTSWRASPSCARCANGARRACL